MGEPEEEEEKAERTKDDKVGLVALGVLVLFLIGVVYWAMPKDGEGKADAGAPASPSASGGPSTSTSTSPPARTKTLLERLGEASCELFILTDKPEEKVHEVATVDGIAKLLDVRYCGAACDAVKKNIADKDRFEVEVSKTDDYILPPKSSFDTVAATLTPAERATIEKRPVGVVIRTKGPSTIDQLPARTCFAATAALAETLGGLVYDETVRRIETAPQLTAHGITVPLGQPVFSPKHIVVQLYRQDDGTARLLTLGMVRFGSPDFTLQGSSMEIGPALASVANAVAAYAASAKSEMPVVVALDDVAKVAGVSPRDLARDPAASVPVKLVSFDHERVEGDPENDMIELLPGGASQEDNVRREAWQAAVRDLFGQSQQTVLAAFDKELEAIATKARKDLPTAVRRFDAGEGALYVKGPFPIPVDPSSTADAGAKEEWMWIQVTSCDAKSCGGTLSNTPGYATNLSAGSPVKVDRSRVADWLLKTKDGSTLGGESINTLQKRR